MFHQPRQSFSDFAVDAIHKKWNNLRTYYFKEVAKTAKSMKSGAGTEQVGTYLYYNFYSPNVPLQSVFSHVSCHFILFVLPGVVEPSLSSLHPFFSSPVAQFEFANAYDPR